MTARGGESERRTVLIAGGGTGGHLTPALAIAAAIEARGDGLEPVLVGAMRGVEARILPTRDYRYHLLPSEPIYRRAWWKNVRWPLVRTHAGSGRKVLFVGSHCTQVPGMTLAVYYPFSQTNWYRASLAYLDLQHQGLVVLMLLLAVLIPGLGTTAGGSSRWLALGPLSLQPSELAKLGLLLVLAAVLGSSRPPWQRFVIALLLSGIGFLILTLRVLRAPAAVADLSGTVLAERLCAASFADLVFFDCGGVPWR